MDVWKEFDQNIITHSAAHHLMAIDDLVQRLGYARVSDVARLLEITRGSVSISLKPMKEAGLILQDENKHLQLSPVGQALVDSIKTKRLLMKRLFTEILSVSPEQAEVDACKLEHLLSDESAQRLVSFMRFVDAEPASLRALLDAWQRQDPTCDHEPGACSTCDTGCFVQAVARLSGRQEDPA